MSAQAAIAASLLWCLIAQASLDDIIPAPKLRPSNPATFSPGSVKMGPDDFEAIRTVLHDSGRDALATRISNKPSLEVLSTDLNALIELALCRSSRAQEWALNKLGSSKPLSDPEILRLLTIVTNKEAAEHSRALAVRVVSRSDLNSTTLGVLVQQIAGAPPDLQVLLLELIGKCGEKARPFSSELQRYLWAPQAAVQFNAFRALFNTGPAATNQAQPFGIGQELLRVADKGKCDEETMTVVLQVLSNVGSAKHLQCAALAALASAKVDSTVLSAILQKVGHEDSFIATIAAHVLERISIPDTAVSTLGDALISTNESTRLQAARALRKIGAAAVSITNSIAAALARAGHQGGSLKESSALLELVKVLGPGGRALGSPIANLLPEQNPIYAGLPKHDAYHLRAWIFLTLSEVGVPKEALPAVMDALANTEDSDGFLFAAAARAAGALGTDAAEAVPFLLRPFQGSMTEQFINFEKFDAHAVQSGEYTTCELEALRALQKIGPAAKSAIPILREFLARPVAPLDNSALFKRVPHPQKEALRTIAALEADGANTGGSVR